MNRLWLEKKQIDETKSGWKEFVTVLRAAGTKYKLQVLKKHARQNLKLINPVKKSVEEVSPLMFSLIRQLSENSSLDRQQWQWLQLYYNHLQRNIKEKDLLEIPKQILEPKLKTSLDKAIYDCSNGLPEVSRFAAAYSLDSEIDCNHGSP